MVLIGLSHAAWTKTDSVMTVYNGWDSSTRQNAGVEKQIKENEYTDGTYLYVNRVKLC